VRRPSRRRTPPNLREVTVLTHDPISLDGRRTPAEKLGIELRRRPANMHSTPATVDRPGYARLDAEMLAAPARTWIEAMEKWRFLLDCYAATPDAQDARIQKLIDRALGDMARLKKREERKT
jgi:hypothetical protein